MSFIIFKIVAYDQEASHVYGRPWSMKLPRVRNHRGGIRVLGYFGAIKSAFLRGKDCSSYITFRNCSDTGVGFGEADSETSQKGVSEKAFKDMLHDLGGKLIQLMHTTMVPDKFQIKMDTKLENIIVREICEVFVDLKLAIRQDLGFIPSGKILGADQLLVILCYRYQESGIGYWILSMTISGSGVSMMEIRLKEVASKRP
ncbi:hypothetical protein Tco_0117382 [Tanacetum coccineum]